MIDISPYPEGSALLKGVSIHYIASSRKSYFVARSSEYLFMEHVLKNEIVVTILARPPNRGLRKPGTMYGGMHSGRDHSNGPGLKEMGNLWYTGTLWLGSILG